MKKILITGLLTAATSGAMAASFDGPFVQLGIGGVATENKTSYQEGTADVLNWLGYSSNQNSNGGSFVGRVDAGWSQAVDKFNLAGSIFYVIGNQDAGSNSFTNTVTNGSNSATISGSQSFTLKNSWGLNLEPGYYVTDKTLGYLKFSWYNAELSTNPSMSLSYNIDGSSGSASLSQNVAKTVNGVGYGLGAKQLFTDNLYGYVEYQYVQYSSVNDGYTAANYKPNQNYGMVGIGYKF